MLSFDSLEYERRLAAVKSLMEQNGVDALFVIDEPNICWLTGYLGYSAYVPQGMLVTLADPQPTLILREMDVACAQASTWLPERNLLCYDERLLGLSERPVWSEVGRVIRSRTRSTRFALERGAWGLTVDNSAALLGALSIDEPVDASGWLNRTRAVKSAAELRYMAEAANIVDAALSAGIDAVRVGVRECDVAATILGKLASGTAAAPGGSPRTSVTMPVGKIANAPHLSWSDRSYERDSQTNFEVGAYRHRYCCALSRTVFLGAPSARLRYIDEVVRDAFEATLPAIRTGARCAEAYAAFWNRFSPMGVRKESRIGYGIGIDWTEGSYSLQRDDERVLMENATVHLIIGIWERDEGYVFSETLRVTDKGAVSFSRLQRSMFVND